MFVTSEIDLLEWDSNFFDKKIGQLILEKKTKVSSKEKFDVIYVKSNREAEVEIEGYFKTLEQTKVIFVKRIIEDENVDQTNIYSIISQPDLREDLYFLAFESGKFSRFLLDVNFNENKFRKLYKKWIDNSFLEGFADDVIVYKEQSEILGLVTYKVVNDYAVIGLIGVSAITQGKGIGSKLIKTVEKKILSSNIFELRIPTQLENQQACRFYTKLGYEIVEKEYIKHFWHYDTIQ